MYRSSDMKKNRLEGKEREKLQLIGGQLMILTAAPSGVQKI